jgi:hypothetical protein
MEPSEITPPANAPPPISTSLASRLFNVFATPGEVFDEVKDGPPSIGNWLVPVCLSILAGIAFSLIVFSQPAIMQKFRDQFDKQEQALDQQVKDGKITQAQADQGRHYMEMFSGPTMMKISGIVGSNIVSFSSVFGWALVAWLVGRWTLHAPFPYMKAVEVTGLSMMIGVLGGIVTLLMVVSFGALSASPSLALVASQLNLSNKWQAPLGVANFFEIWFAVAVSIGLARLTGVSFGRAASRFFACWLAWKFFWVALGMIFGRGQAAM